MENIKKDSNSRTEKYSEWNEKCNGEYQQQNRSIRRQELWNYPIRGEQMKKNEKKNEESLCDSWNTIKRTNLWIIGVPEEERKKRGRKVI